MEGVRENEKNDKKFSNDSELNKWIDGLSNNLYGSQG